MAEIDKDIEVNDDNACGDVCPIDFGDSSENVEETKENNILDEINDLKDKNLRLMAEYDNFRKRSAKERAEFYSDATARTINEILPVIDNLERALETECSDENFKQGISLILNQMNDILKKLNVEQINPIGEVFDHNVANAISQVEDENLGENIVAEVFQKGYKIGDKVIRYAMVVVANS